MPNRRNLRQFFKLTSSALIQFFLVITSSSARNTERLVLPPLRHSDPLFIKMPTYVYQEILPNGSDGEAFEYIQSMSEEALKLHPKTGNPVRKVFHAPNVSSKYTEGSTKKKLSDENVEKHGFTRYEKDKVTGRYNKTAGKDKRAPDVVDANQLKKMQQKGIL